MALIYIDDCGIEMNEEDFKAYIFWKIEDWIRNGVAQEFAVTKLTSEDYYGDNIIDINAFRFLSWQIQYKYYVSNEIIFTTDEK